MLQGGHGFCRFVRHLRPSRLHLNRLNVHLGVRREYEKGARLERASGGHPGVAPGRRARDGPVGGRLGRLDPRGRRPCPFGRRPLLRDASHDRYDRVRPVASEGRISGPAHRPRPPLPFPVWQGLARDRAKATCTSSTTWACTRALSVLRAGADQATDIAPIDEFGADEIVPFENWILISVPVWRCGDRQQRLMAVPTTPDRPVVQLAGDMGTTAVMGTYLAYGDLAGNIHLSTPDQVRAALANATR